LQAKQINPATSPMHAVENWFASSSTASAASNMNIFPRSSASLIKVKEGEKSFFLILFASFS
jgi:hypothetical protein